MIRSSVQSLSKQLLSRQRDDGQRRRSSLRSGREGRLPGRAPHGRLRKRAWLAHLLGLACAQDGGQLGLLVGRENACFLRSGPGAPGAGGGPGSRPGLSVRCRFPGLHSAVIRTFVLVQHYAAAMMAVSGLSQMKSYTSVETLEITQNLINAPKQCPCGHGLMVLLRVPCSPLAAVAYERLAHVRARLALDRHFEIILGHPSSSIAVGKHFVQQLKVGARPRDGRGGRGRTPTRSF